MDRSHSLIGKPTPELIVDAYRQGFFPMAHGKSGPMQFFYYEPRAIIPLDERFTIRRSLRQIIKKKTFEIRFDTSFEEVIRSCARHEELEDEGIWLSEDMIALYIELHKRGIAHSIETWAVANEKMQLLGGLYGLALGSIFCGESMFSKAPFASQVALVALVEHLRKQGFTLLDAQMESEHLQQFGLYTVSQDQYLKMLNERLMNQCQW